MDSIINWVCLSCRKNLIENTDGLFCISCGQKYPIIDGIPIFSEGDVFYEGKYSTFRRLYHGSVKPNVFWRIINKIEQHTSLNYDERRRSLFEKFLPKKGLVIDLGCGGGWDVFLKPDLKIVGCDVSYISLKTARLHYFSVFQGCISNLPFPDCYFDIAVSSDVLGHITDSKKKKVLAELYRVIKPGGIAILTIETESKDPLSRICRRNKELYNKYFLSPHGHHGLKYPSEVVLDFKNVGFRIKYIKKTIGYLWPVGYYHENIKGDYLKYNHFLRLIGIYSDCLIKLNNLININGLRWVARFQDILFGLVGQVLDMMLPIDMARGIGIVIEKPKT